MSHHYPVIDMIEVQECQCHHSSRLIMTFSLSQKSHVAALFPQTFHHFFPNFWSTFENGQSEDNKHNVHYFLQESSEDGFWGILDVSMVEYMDQFVALAGIEWEAEAHTTSIVEWNESERLCGDSLNTSWDNQM